MNLGSTMAAQSYASARPATAPGARPEQGTAAGFAQGMGALAHDFAATLREGEHTAMAAMTGGADPHALVQALSATELAVETAVTLRDKVVEAYQEILRMPV